jgi:hypothetical protein
MTSLGTRQTYRMSRWGDPAITLAAATVLDGTVIAGQLIKLACQRHLDDLARQNRPSQPS